jgi:hypothetical protein
MLDSNCMILMLMLNLMFEMELLFVERKVDFLLMQLL